MDRTARHITLSNQRGMVTELEMTTDAFTAGGRYVLRYHKTRRASATLFDISSSDAAFWTGFRYHDTQWSFVKFAAKPGTVVGVS